MTILLFLAAQAAAPAPPAVPTVEIDVPTGHGRQSVQSHTREFAVGASSGWHTHPGIEMGIVISGEMEMRLADGSVRRFTAGQTFVIPRGTVHNGVNVAEGPSRMAITYVYDKGKPVRIRVPEPRVP